MVRIHCRENHWSTQIMDCESAYHWFQVSSSSSIRLPVPSSSEQAGNSTPVWCNSSVLLQLLDNGRNNTFTLTACQEVFTLYKNNLFWISVSKQNSCLQRESQKALTGSSSPLSCAAEPWRSQDTQRHTDRLWKLLTQTSTCFVEL